MLFSLKSYAKKCFTVWRNYFSIKSYSTFSAKMFQAPFILIMVYCIPYMEVNVDFLPYMEVNVGKKKKKGKTWRNEVDTKTGRIFYGRIPLSELNNRTKLSLKGFLHRKLTFDML